MNDKKNLQCHHSYGDIKKKKDEKKNNKEEKKKEECNFVPRAQNSFEFPAVVHFAQDCSRREFSSC